MKDNAIFLVDKIIPEDFEAEQKAMELALNYLNKQGITSAHDMGTYNDYKVYKRNQQKLTVRIYSAIELSSWKKLADIIRDEGKGNDLFRIGILKGYIDGSLGSMTALQFYPYNGTNEYGLQVETDEDLYNWIKNADKENLQVAVHAIGDRAVNSMLNIFEKVAKENGKKDRRFRIEHSQQIIQKDRSRYNELEIIASMQPYHLLDDALYAEVYHFKYISSSTRKYLEIELKIYTYGSL